MSNKYFNFYFSFHIVSLSLFLALFTHFFITLTSAATHIDLRDPEKLLPCVCFCVSVWCVFVCVYLYECVVCVCVWCVGVSISVWCVCVSVCVCICLSVWCVCAIVCLSVQKLEFFCLLLGGAFTTAMTSLHRLFTSFNICLLRFLSQVSYKIIFPMGQTKNIKVMRQFCM